MLLATAAVILSARRHEVRSVGGYLPPAVGDVSSQSAGRGSLTSTEHDVLPNAKGTGSSPVSGDTSANSAAAAPGNAGQGRYVASEGSTDAVGPGPKVEALRGESLKATPPGSHEPLHPTVEVQTIVLGSIQFETNRSTLSADAQMILQNIARSLRNIPNGNRVAIIGHTDAIGSPEANALLSQRRAEAVRNFLVDHGVGHGELRLSYVGASAPMASDASPEGRASNRRVVIQLQSP